MSATSTTTVYLTGQTVPSDYALYHSPVREEDGDAAVPEPQPDLHSALGSTANPNPLDWQDQWRRVPSYRPRRNQIGPERDTGRTAMEARIIHFFFGGLIMVSEVNRVWRRAGGSGPGDFFRYKIGGEW